MSTRVGQPRIKGNTTYYRLATDADETPVRLHDDIAEIADRLGPNECSPGKVEVRYVGSDGKDRKQEVAFDGDGQHRSVYQTWQFSQQRNLELPLWFFDVTYRGTKFRIKLDLPARKMVVAVNKRDEDMSIFEEFMYSLEGKDDWRFRERPAGTGSDQDDYAGITRGYSEVDDSLVGQGEIAKLVSGTAVPAAAQTGAADAYGRGSLRDDYQDGYGDRYDAQYDAQYDDYGDGDGYADGYRDDPRAGYRDGRQDRYDNQYGDQYGDRYDDEYGDEYDDRYDDGYGPQDGYADGGAPTTPRERIMPQRQPGEVSGDPYQRYFSIALAETIVTSVAGLVLIVLLNLETHLGISVTSMFFCAILLIAPLLSVSALTRVTSAHKVIAEDYVRGMQSYGKARRRMIIVAALLLVWVVVIAFVGFKWYTHSLPPQLSGLYGLLDHSVS